MIWVKKWNRPTFSFGTLIKHKVVCVVFFLIIPIFVYTQTENALEN